MYIVKQFLFLGTPLNLTGVSPGMIFASPRPLQDLCQVRIGTRPSSWGEISFIEKVGMEVAHINLSLVGELS